MYWLNKLDVCHQGFKNNNMSKCVQKKNLYVKYGSST